MADEAFRDTLSKIYQLAGSALHLQTLTAPGSTSFADWGCSIKSLPDRLQIDAAKTARRVNPVNAARIPPLPRGMARSLVLDPQRIAVLTTKYWGPSPRVLSVSFMDPTTPQDLRARIVSHMNAWATSCCISFQLSSGVGQVRISFGSGGYWSYLGTDILHIPSNRQTMNLQGFSMSTPDSEYHRVVRHETGHTLGCPHEHMRQALVARIDPVKAYDYFWQTQRWDRPTVDQQVLTPLDENSLMKTPPDQDSIMCYQLPGTITYDGMPIRGGTDINPTDAAFLGSIYPQTAPAAPASSTSRQPADTNGAMSDDWPSHQDVQVGDINC